MTGLRATVVVAAGRGATMALSFALGILSARYFGAGTDKDSYLVAKTLPTLLINVLVGGVVPLLLVALARVPEAERAHRAGAILRGATRRLALVLGPLLVALWLGAARVVAWMAPGFPPDQVELTTRLFRISLLAVLGALCVAFMKALFNAGAAFTLPSAASALVGVTALAVLLLGIGRFGIVAMPLGDMLGQWAAGALLVAVALAGGRLRWRGSTGPHETSEAEGAFWGPFLVMCLGSNFGSVNVLVDNYFASFLSAGSISSLGYASVLITSAQSLFIFSAAEIAFARLARASGDLPRFREDAGRILRALVLGTLPIVAGVFALGRPIVRAVFERGAFDASTTDLVARLLNVLAPELLLMSFLALFWRVLVARGAYGIVGWVAALSIACNVGLDAILLRVFGIAGIALATPLVTLITTAAYWPAVRRACGPIWRPEDVTAASKAVLAATVMGLAVAAWATWFEGTIGTTTGPLRILLAGSGMLLGGGLYAVLLQIFGVRDAFDLGRRVLGALRPA